MSRETAARITATLGALVLVGAILWLVFGKRDHITVATWGGAYQEAQTAAMFAPFTDDTGVEIRTAAYRGGVAELARQRETGRLEWDVVDLTLTDAAEACRKGLIEPARGAMPPGRDGSDAAADFASRALGPCWAASVIDSEAIAFNPARFPAGAPSTAAQFFDLARFPGGRGLRDAPRGTLEFALAADGVPAREIYDVLSTPEGVSRAFAKLETIRAVTWWWKAASEPAAMLADGRVAMTTLQSAVIPAGYGVIWDGQRYELHAFAVVRGTLRKDDAFAFIRFATSSGPLARIAGRTRLGPARRSSLALMPESARNASPTAHLENALAIDPNWWAVQGAAIEARWREWRRR
jgi:putative spermidine/putrescine transport system substrate-binding protein